MQHAYVYALAPRRCDTKNEVVVTVDEFHTNPRERKSEKSKEGRRRGEETGTRSKPVTTRINYTGNLKERENWLTEQTNIQSKKRKKEEPTATKTLERDVNLGKRSNSEDFRSSRAKITTEDSQK